MDQMSRRDRWIMWSRRCLLGSLLLAVCLLLAPAQPGAAGQSPASVPIAAPAATPASSEPVKWYRIQPSFGGEPEFLYAIAARLLGNGDRHKEIFDLNQGRLQPDGGRLTDTTVLKPGWLLVLPPDAEGEGVQFSPLPAVAEPAPAPPAAPSSEPTPAQSGAGAPAAEAPPAAEPPASSGSPVLLGTLVAVLVLVGLGVGVFLLRRRQPATSPSGVARGASGPAPAAGKPAVRPATGAGRARWQPPRPSWLGRAKTPAAPAARYLDTAAAWTLDRALRVLATTCAGSDQPFPEFYAVSLYEDRVVLRLTSPSSPPPAPWQLTDDGLGWVAPMRQLQATTIDPDVSLPVLLLVTIGTADGSRVLLDLGRCTGVVGLEGNRRAAGTLVAGWVTELVGSPWSDRVRVVLAGAREVPVPSDEKGDVVVVSGPRQVPATFGTEAATDATATDADQPADEERPNVIILGGPPSATELEELQRLHASQRVENALLVFGAGDRARWSLTLNEDGSLDTGVLGLRVNAGVAGG